MKKILLILLALVLLTGCRSKDSSTANNTIQAPSSTTDVTKDVSNSSSVTKNTEGTISNDKLEIIKEYSIKTNPRSNYTEHIIIIQNNNDTECWVKSNSKAYDAEGNLLGVSNSSSDEIAPGYQGIIIERFDEIDGVLSYETTLSATESSFSREINSIISIDLEATSSKVFVTLTNNGDYSAELVKTYVLFLDENGNCIDYDYQYMEATGTEIKPGESVAAEFKTDESYASAEVYISGDGEIE